MIKGFCFMFIKIFKDRDKALEPLREMGLFLTENERNNQSKGIRNKK